MQIGRSLKHFSRFLTIALSLGVLIPIAFDAEVEAVTCYEDVIVSNAAFEPANATYRFVDYYQYKPRYRRIHEDGTFCPPYENITWGGNRWIIMVGGTNRYEASADTPTPPTVMGCDGCPNPWLRLAAVYGPTTITVQGGGEFVSLGGPTTTKVTTGEAYVYAPKVPEGCAGSYSFSVINQPMWMSFDATTGELTGTPTAADIGTYSGIQITATDSDGDDVVTEVFAIGVDAASGESSDGAGTKDPMSTYDLALTSLSTGGDPWWWAAQTESVTCFVEVTNLGGLTSPVSKAVVSWSDAAEVGGETEYAIPALESGATHKFSHTIPSGSQYLLHVEVAVDEGYAVYGADATNNEKDMLITIGMPENEGLDEAAVSGKADPTTGIPNWMTHAGLCQCMTDPADPTGVKCRIGAMFSVWPFPNTIPSGTYDTEIQLLVWRNGVLVNDTKHPLSAGDYSFAQYQTQPFFHTIPWISADDDVEFRVIIDP